MPNPIAHSLVMINGNDPKALTTQVCPKIPRQPFEMFLLVSHCQLVRCAAAANNITSSSPVLFHLPRSTYSAPVAKKNFYSQCASFRVTRGEKDGEEDTKMIRPWIKLRESSGRRREWRDEEQTNVRSAGQHTITSINTSQRVSFERDCSPKVSLSLMPT